MRDEDADGYLWTTPWSTQPWESGSSFARTFERCCVRAELTDVKPYDLRKFAVTQIHKWTRSIPVTMQFSGGGSDGLRRIISKDNGIVGLAFDRKLDSPGAVRYDQEQQQETCLPDKIERLY